MLENWKTAEPESDDETNCKWCFCIGTRTGGFGKKRISGDHPNYRIQRRLEEICCHSNSSGKLSANAGVKVVNYRKRSIKLDTTRWGRWFTENCARSLNLTIRTSDTCTAQNSFEIQTDDLISTRRPDSVIVNKKKKKKKIGESAK